MKETDNTPFGNRHMEDMLARYPKLQRCGDSVKRAWFSLEKCVATGHVIYLCGNGGSASDAEHWAGELLKGFVSKRPLPETDRDQLPAELAQGLQWAIPAIPLTGFPAFSTAFANDVEPGLVFAQLVWALGRPGDILVGLSTSGNSSNVVHAAQAAKARGMSVISLTGETGGKLAGLADVCVAVPERETARVQELHLPVYHCLSLMLEERFEPSADRSIL